MSNNPAPVQEWTFEDAQAQFAEVFRLARTQGPQRISRPTGSVVVIPAEQFESKTPDPAKEESLGEFLARSPLRGSGVEFTREQDFGRDIDL